MTAMAIGFLVVGALFAVLGAVNQAWFERCWPGGRMRDASPGWRRTLFLFLAVALAYWGIKGLRLADETSWSNRELRDTVNEAASALEQEPQLDDPQGDYHSLVDSEVRKAGKGSGPVIALDVTTADKNSYTVTATGAGDGFCLHITRSESADGAFVVPGAGDQPNTVVPEYDLKTKVSSGSC
ncbi:hypothetical protein [Streptomyces sp. NPDC052225]|uniref:hypothetical protein n=1 Tax=Streptomyces sp. NPDC052225 TaxID=3154949 RepID=UPI003436B93D